MRKTLAALAICLFFSGGATFALNYASNTTITTPIDATGGNVQIGSAGGCTVTLSGSGKWTNLQTSNTIQAGRSSYAVGTLVIDGATQSQTGPIQLGYGGVFTGTLTIKNSGSFIAAGTSYASEIGWSGTGIFNMQGGTADFWGGLNVGYYYSNNNPATGTVTQTGGTINTHGKPLYVGSTGGTGMSNFGAYTISGGALTLGTGTLDLTGGQGATVNGGATFEIDTNAPSVTATNGYLYTRATSGTGNIYGTHLIFGVDSSGVAPISVTTLKDYTGGVATSNRIAGSLVMNLLNGYTPTNGTVYTLITGSAGAITNNLSLADTTHWHLLVNGDTGYDSTKVKIMYIGNLPPVADAGDDTTVHDLDGGGSQSVTLDGTGSTDDSGIVSYVWMEGSTQLYSGANASTTVTLPVGMHTITLTVTDGSGATDDDTVVLTVAANQAPLADAGADSGLVDSGTGTTTVTLDGGGSTDDGTLNYAWNENGSQLATGATPQVSLVTGRHDIQLVVTDQAGLTSRDVVRVWIAPAGNYFVDAVNGNDNNAGTSAAVPYKTVNKVLSKLQSLGAGAAGKVVILRAGTYREMNTVRIGGAAGSPITFMGKPLERVILSGADTDVNGGWTQCDSSTASGNPNYTNIYYKDVTRATDGSESPTRLIQDNISLTGAQMPIHGGWRPTGGTSTTLVDTVNLTQSTGYWVGAHVYLHHFAGSNGNFYDRAISAFDGTTHTLTLSSTWTITPDPNVDQYYLYGAVQAISQAGQWAVQDRGSGNYRLFAWTTGGDSPNNHAMEASRYKWLLYHGTNSYWVYDNLEFANCRSASGTITGSLYSTNSGGSNVTVRNCSFHHSDGYSLCLSGMSNVLVQNNVFAHNRYGPCITDCSNSTILNNDIGFAWEDGCRLVGRVDSNWTTGDLLKGNYIHDNARYNHADCEQTFNKIKSTTFQDNLFIHGGQSIIMQSSDTFTLKNNIMIGSAAVSVIFGGGSTNGTMDHNSVLLAGGSLMTPSVSSFALSNNILLLGNGVNRDLAIDSTTPTYTSDYNCVFAIPGYANTPIVWNGGWNWTWSQYVTNSGRDSHSSNANPLLANIPLYITACDYLKVAQFTSTRIYMDSHYIGMFAVNDHIEIGWDGSMQTVTAMGANYIDFTPGNPSYMDLDLIVIANWKNATSTAIDLTPQTGSPVINAASDGTNVGSSINWNDYFDSDFNSDGRRDVPDWPDEDGSDLPAWPPQGSS